MMPPWVFRKLLPRSIKNVLRWFAYCAIFSDPRSIVAFTRSLPASKGQDRRQAFVDLRIRALKGRQVRIRTQGTDAEVLFNTFAQKFHLPPRNSMGREPERIIDLGANIGLTTAHFAELFPKASIVAIELDGENANLAKHNTETWCDRCRVLHGAIWPQDGEVLYQSADVKPDSYVAVDLHRAAAAEEKRSRAYSMATICDRFFPYQQVDYVKMDVEGAESDLLRINTSWVHRVRCIQVELHGLTSEWGLSQLTDLGFKAIPSALHPNAVIGLRNLSAGPSHGDFES